MTTLTTAQAVVSMLEVNGIDTIFCLPGVQNDAFFDALYDRTNAIKPIHARHEQACAYMALGYAMATGQAVGLRRRAGARLPQHHGGAVDGLCGERAGAGADRPDPAGHDRPQCRAAARAARPARHHARPHQVGRPHQRARRGARPGQRSLPPPAVRPAASGGARMRDGHLGAQGAGRAHSDAGQGRPLPRRRGRASSAPPSFWAARSAR